MIAVKDINRYELHFRQFMLMANTVTTRLVLTDNTTPAQDWFSLITEPKHKIGSY